MFTNVMLGGDLKRLAEQHRRDLAAQWGRPPVPTALRPGESRGRRPVLRWFGRRAAGSVPVTPTC